MSAVKRHRAPITLVETMTAAALVEQIRQGLRCGDGAGARRVFDRVRAADPRLAQRVADGLTAGVAVSWPRGGGEGS
jgi:hypothetical protein